jgi:plasmid stabilization system protein ParE
MANEIIWSPLSVETYDEILNYLLDKFGEQAVIKFVNVVDRKLKMIKARPKMFRPTKTHSNTYIASLHKRTTLTYRYKPHKKQIELVVFWGMQNPHNKPD